MTLDELDYIAAGIEPETSGKTERASDAERLQYRGYIEDVLSRIERCIGIAGERENLMRAWEFMNDERASVTR